MKRTEEWRISVILSRGSYISTLLLGHVVTGDDDAGHVRANDSFGDVGPQRDAPQLAIDAPLPRADKWHEHDGCSGDGEAGVVCSGSMWRASPAIEETAT